MEALGNLAFNLDDFKFGETLLLMVVWEGKQLSKCFIARFKTLQLLFFTFSQILSNCRRIVVPESAVQKFIAFK